jgi:hypothetical protein
MAHNYLGAAGTFVACEQAFSKAGRTVNALCTLLHDDSIQAVSKLQSYLSFLTIAPVKEFDEDVEDAKYNDSDDDGGGAGSDEDNNNSDNSDNNNSDDGNNNNNNNDDSSMEEDDIDNENEM